MKMKTQNQHLELAEKYAVELFERYKRDSKMSFVEWKAFCSRYQSRNIDKILDEMEFQYGSSFKAFFSKLYRSFVNYYLHQEFEKEFRRLQLHEIYQSSFI